MEIFIIAAPGVLIGLFLGLLTRNAGTVGLLFLVFILSIAGEGDFSGNRLVFWILCGSILTHATKIPALQILLDGCSRIRIRRIPRIKKRSREPVELERDNNSPEDFWGSVESLSDVPKETEPMSDSFWNTVESNTNKIDKESDESSSHT